MRARLLKPGYFKNDELADLPPLTRILFAGLWCMADREGRLEDRPRRIKSEVLSYDDCDVNAMLDDLAGAGFIHRYTAEGGRFIQVLQFGRHQTPHVREPASMIPAPDEHCASTVPALDEHESGPAVPDPVTEAETVPEAESTRARARATPAAPAKAPVYSAAFLAFWQSYPPKGRDGKPATWAVWQTLRPDGELADAILAGVARWQVSQRWKDGYVVAARRWLKERRWEDEPPAASPHQARASPNGRMSTGEILAWAGVTPPREEPTDDDRGSIEARFRHVADDVASPGDRPGDGQQPERAVLPGPP